MNESTLAWGLTAAGVAVALYCALLEFANLPVVHIDHLTKECVSVESVNKNITCDQLPSRYHTVQIAHR